MTCADCLFFRPAGDGAGECRRLPPCRPGNFPDEPWRFPVVDEAASCGEHTPKKDLDQ
jgi:hypothetical protein